MQRGLLKATEALRGLTLYPSTWVKVLFILYVVAIPSLTRNVAILKVSINIKVVVHALRLTFLSCVREILLQLLQFV